VPVFSQISSALEKDTHLVNLLVDPTFSAEISRRQMAWRPRERPLGVASGATPALSALSYYDQYRRESLPANGSIA
jgi:6-phosphogluconate dehydrogenase